MVSLPLLVTMAGNCGADAFRDGAGTGCGVAAAGEGDVSGDVTVSGE
jgi:hypothetical protein